MYNVLSPCSPISLSCNVEVKADNEPSIEVALFKEAQSKMKQKIVSTVAREQYVLGYKYISILFLTVPPPPPPPPFVALLCSYHNVSYITSQNCDCCC